MKTARAEENRVDILVCGDVQQFIFGIAIKPMQVDRERPRFKLRGNGAHH